MTKEKILIGTTHDFEIKDQIFSQTRALSEHVRCGLADSQRVILFAELEDFQDIFKGGEKTFAKYENVYLPPITWNKNQKQFDFFYKYSY